MNILFVNHLKPTAASCLRQQGLGKQLSVAGHRVEFMVRRPLSISESDRVSSEFHGKVTYWDEPFEQMFPQNLMKLVRKSRDFQLMHVNKAYPITSLMLSAPKFIGGKKIVMDWEDWDGIGGFISLARKNIASRFALGFFEEVVPNACDSIIAVSNILVERARKKGIPSERISYVPNGYDETLFDPKLSGASIRLKYDLGSRPTVIFISALHSYEGENFTKIFDSMKLVVEKIPDAVLEIAGQGEIGKIFEYVKKLGIERNFVYLGFIPHSKIAEAIASADVAVHILRDTIYFRSSSPMVVPEYMAMGKPVIASDVGELSVMLKDDAGILVKDQTPRAFSEAIVRLLNDSKTRRKVGMAALERASRMYSYRILARQVEEAYQRALESRKH